ncbi:hypothetical protein PC110_g20908 [Phytophthora cactorum]|uniref:Uncharacterized protein n=1 Tax=Phytophthora cactorum TaxID=29920 RepID=A0A329RDA1_9STRA|nr:hypothetical protein PC113_g22664 [Phytophthora cactorum]RAW22653.1 hypothetical protein PC110_g20908 [Phytophthora cactorum]
MHEDEDSDDEDPEDNVDGAPTLSMWEGTEDEVFMASLGGLDVLLVRPSIWLEFWYVEVEGYKTQREYTLIMGVAFDEQFTASGTVFYDKRNVAYKVDARSPLMILWWRRDVDVFVKLYRVVLVNEMALVALSMAVSLLSKSWLGV